MQMSMRLRNVNKAPPKKISAGDKNSVRKMHFLLLPLAMEQLRREINLKCADTIKCVFQWKKYKENIACKGRLHSKRVPLSDGYSYLKYGGSSNSDSNKFQVVTFLT